METADVCSKNAIKVRITKLSDLRNFSLIDKSITRQSLKTDYDMLLAITNADSYQNITEIMSKIIRSQPLKKYGTVGFKIRYLILKK